MNLKNILKIIMLNIKDYYFIVIQDGYLEELVLKDFLFY